MSFFSFIGKIGSTIGKTALGAVGSTVGLPGLSTVFDKRANAPAATAPVVVATAASINPYQPDNVNNAGGASLLGLAKNFLSSASDFLSGRSHAQIDANVGAGGRLSDPYGNSSSGSMLPWFLGGGVLLFVLFSGGSRSKGRY
ncbi:hypothetical protein [Mucilaginibacter sp. 10B2]|uniref:hypothetical protein n=1 Tax=Mucilaginibacter sp. 10B2 TaxID=3048574 RepID=UPI002B235D32|nr:hypothetical protein [Mucilaginibacter sp. 10B2]MEB0278965.1 hypothetical protein [Mucilaginibacter sp. 10B2]